MSYKVELTENFRREAKKLIKRYSSLKDEIINLGKELAENPTLGTNLGNDVYKIRLAIASKNKGKSGGARVISFVKIIDTTVYLLAIYSKGEIDNISDKEIKELLSTSFTKVNGNFVSIKKELDILHIKVDLLNAKTSDGLDNVGVKIENLTEEIGKINKVTNYEGIINNLNSINN